LTKLAGGATAVEWLTIASNVPGLWIHGGRHVFLAPALPPRYAGNTLLWQEGSLTFRLEGRSLTRGRAVALAATLLGR
jgi:hypothetical protein